ncbi:MAG: tetratricopeptide repeat protein [Calditrichaeota bacterium]|nr:tetratricopeptide repeat protein [Calditrichota bacterium]
MPGIEELEQLQEILHNNPESYSFARLADRYLENEDAYRAVQICEDGLKQHPHYVNGHFIYAKALLAIEELDRAETELKRVLLYDPKHLGARYYLAQIARSRGWTQNYLTELETILSIDPLFERASTLLQSVQEELKETKGPLHEKSEQTPQPESKEESFPVEETASPTLPSDDQELTKMVAEHLSEAEEVEETPLPPGEERPEEEPARASEEVETPPVEEPPKDEKEEFDYILDEIFEDEVLSGETETREELTEEDLSSAIHKRVESLDESDEESQEFFTEEEKEFINQEPPAVETALSEEVPPAPESAEEPPAEEISTVEETEPEETPLSEDETTEAPPPQPEPDVYEIAEEHRGTTAIVTPTLGEIYAAQGHYSKAIGVYEILLKKDPDNQTYKDKIAYLRGKLAEEQGKSGD